MAWEIKKESFDGVDLLPEIVDTPLWPLIDPDRNSHPKPTERQIAGLYNALQRRENYFQENTPTAYGNPEYNLYCGVVSGFLQAMDAYEHEENDQIVIRKDRKKLLVIDKVHRPRWYFEAQREIREAMAAVL